MTLMLGDAIDDRMAVSGVKWLHQQGCHVMAMSPDKKDYGHHNYPLEHFVKQGTVLRFILQNETKNRPLFHRPLQIAAASQLPLHSA